MKSEAAAAAAAAAAAEKHFCTKLYEYTSRHAFQLHSIFFFLSFLAFQKCVIARSRALSHTLVTNFSIGERSDTNKQNKNIK